MMKKGEAGQFQNLLIGSVIVVLFAFLVLTWMFEFSTNNNIDTTSLESQGAFNFTAINQSLSGVQGEAESLKNIFTQSEGEEINIIEGVFSVTGTFFSLPVRMIAFVVDLFDLVIIDGFGYMFNYNPVGSIIIEVIAGIIIFGIIFSIIRMLKAGD